MGYEFDGKFPKPGTNASENQVFGEEMVSGRWKSACEGAPPATLCYGFVFEENPSGPDMCPRSDLQPKHGDTDQLDIELPGIIREASVEALQEARKEYYWDEQRARGDRWIGPPREWRRRREMVEEELRRRGVALELLR